MDDGARLVGAAAVGDVLALVAPAGGAEGLEQGGRVGPARVGDQGLAAGAEQPRQEGGEGAAVALLVEQVGADGEVGRAAGEQ